MLPMPIRYAVLLALALPCGAAHAETLDQLDELVDATADEAGGIAYARTQAQNGRYLEALSTLERVLGAFPTSRAALLDHAVYLCQVDDRQGGRVELQLLRERDYDAREWSDAQAICAYAVQERVITQPPPVREQAPPPPPPASNSKPKVN